MGAVVAGRDTRAYGILNNKMAYLPSKQDFESLLVVRRHTELFFFGVTLSLGPR